MKLDFNSMPKVCISLKHNHERREKVKLEFSKIGIEVFPYWYNFVVPNGHCSFYNAVDKQTLTVPECSAKRLEGNAAGILACATSHINVIREAKERNYPAICIFEDDVVFCDDFQKRLEYIESLDMDFDIFALGGHFDKEMSTAYTEPTNWRNVVKVKQMGGTYALIITNKVYDFILRNWNYNFGADEFLSNHVYCRFNTYAFVPFLCGTYPNYSDVAGGMSNYVNVTWQYQQGPISVDLLH
jgi:GR25 family glycosyltransferase involved in LPS biosynthesis